MDFEYFYVFERLWKIACFEINAFHCGTCIPEKLCNIGAFIV